MNMAEDSKSNTTTICVKAAAKSLDDANYSNEAKTTDCGRKQAPERILRRTSRENNIRYTMYGEEAFESPSDDIISPGVNEESERKGSYLKMENNEKTTKIDPFKIVHKMHRRLSMIRTANEENQPDLVASKPVLEFDVSKYVDDNWELDETKIGLFPDDDYALTYKDNPDALPALFEEDERFVFVDGLIQLAPEPVKPTFGMIFQRQTSNKSTDEKKIDLAGTACKKFACPLIPV